MKIFSAQLKGTTTVVSGSTASITGSFTGSIAGIDINETNAFTASTIARLNSIETISSSNDSRVNSLEVFSSSIFTTNTFTSSASERLNALETTSASVLTLNSTQNDRLNSLETTSASVDTLNSNQNTRLNNLEDKTGSLATTGSNTFYGTQTFTGSVYIRENLIVQGSSSLQNITASAVDIGTNKIILNVDNPAIRFAGISVYDSGSTQGTGSLWWDSTQNHWLYEHPSDSAAPYNSAILISGPKNTGNLGEELELVNNYIVKAVGGDHISSSAIYDDGSNISLKSNTQITGSLSVMGDGGVLNRTTSGEPYLFFRKNGVNRGSIYGIDGGGLRIFDESDNQVLTITGSKVGIGTTNPFGSLHVVNNTNTYIRIQATANNGSAELDLLSNGGQNAYIDFGPNDLRFRSTNSDMSALNNSAVLSLTNGGRVGVGTTDPGYKFHISGSSQVTSYFQTSGTYAPISWTGDNGTTKGGVIAHGGNIGIGGLNSYGTGIDGDKSLTIKSGSGFVGINTTSVNVPLVISTTGNTTDGTFYSTLTINNTGTSTYSRVRFDRDGVARWGLTLLNNDTFGISNLYENGTVTANDSTFVIRNNGNIGIGTTSPNSILEIAATTPTFRIQASDSNNFHGIEFRQGAGFDAFIKQHPNSGEFRISSGRTAEWGGNITFYTDTSERLKITSAGDFKIPWANNRLANIMEYDNDYRMGLFYQANARTLTVFSTGSDGGGSISFNTRGTGATGGATDYGLERMRINPSGNITTPYQPAFMAYGNGNSSIEPNGTYMIYPTVHFNRGNHYNASNGVFTAPVSGLYFFSWTAIGNTTNDVYRWFLRVNDVNFLGDVQLRQDTNETGSAYAHNGNRQVLANLSAGNTVRIYFTADAGSQPYGANDSVNAYLNFMGHLIG
jgi:hypothetical protein